MRFWFRISVPRVGITEVSCKFHEFSVVFLINTTTPPSFMPHFLTKKKIKKVTFEHLLCIRHTRLSHTNIYFFESGSNLNLITSSICSGLLSTFLEYSRKLSVGCRASADFSKRRSMATSSRSWIAKLIIPFHIVCFRVLYESQRS